LYRRYEDAAAHKHYSQLTTPIVLAMPDIDGVARDADAFSGPVDTDGHSNQPEVVEREGLDCKPKEVWAEVDKDEVDNMCAATAAPAWPDGRDEELRIAIEHLEARRQEAYSSQVPASLGSPSAHNPDANQSFMEMFGRQTNRIQAMEQKMLAIMRGQDNLFKTLERVEARIAAVGPPNAAVGLKSPSHSSSHLLYRRSEDAAMPDIDDVARVADSWNGVSRNGVS
jgi:hypothetical protein